MLYFSEIKISVLKIFRHSHIYHGIIFIISGLESAREESTERVCVCACVRACVCNTVGLFNRYYHRSCQKNHSG